MDRAVPDRHPDPHGAGMSDLSTLISSAVAARMTPEFIEKEVNARVDKLIVESVDRALRSYSDTGKKIEKAVEEALQVDNIDLPSYGTIVTQMLKTQIEALVAPLVAGRLAQDMEELLSLAPKEVKLSQIADDMREQHEAEGYGGVITVIVEEGRYQSRWIYLDDRNHYNRAEKYKCRFSILLRDDGTISSARVDERDPGKGWVGIAYGLEQRLRAYVAVGTKIIIDEDAVITS
ncbi:MAG: hypothetical protein CMN72_09540, partial [Sphingomonas sp.]|nr:hypothetical protein [Sphingomonas sp.]